MRISIEIDDSLMRQAMQLGGVGAEEAVVESALRLSVQTRQQSGIRKLRGRVEWEGNLEQSRRGRNVS
ncbi:MAG TPA: type II toxin-antitoxin system VapB family antitoxin [Terriglobales bacterium]|nr:type II toxin-antitoxin system VapB family antitoxin [Terriglobales bacterium]